MQQNPEEEILQKINLLPVICRPAGDQKRTICVQRGMAIGNLSEFTGNARVDERCFGILNIFCQYQVWQTIANGAASKVIESKEDNLRTEGDGNWQFDGIYGQCRSG